MRYIKDANGEIHAFDETSHAQINLMHSMFFSSGTLNADCTDVSGAWPLPPTAAQLRQQLQAQAQAELSSTDMVAMRCLKAGVAYPTAWQTYTQALRAIANGTDTTSAALPVQPAFPAGT